MWRTRPALSAIHEAPHASISGVLFMSSNCSRLLGLQVRLTIFFKVGCLLPSDTPVPLRIFPWWSLGSQVSGIVSSVLPQLANKLPLALEEGPLSLLPIPIMLFHYGPHWSIHNHSQSKLLMA